MKTELQNKLKDLESEESTLKAKISYIAKEIKIVKKALKDYEDLEAPEQRQVHTR